MLCLHSVHGFTRMELCYQVQVCRKAIHGWGLFAVSAIKADAIVAQYHGEYITTIVITLPSVSRLTCVICDHIHYFNFPNNDVCTGSRQKTRDVWRDKCQWVPVYVSTLHFLLSALICISFRLHDTTVVDATFTNCAGRYANHSCNPNCTIIEHTMYVFWYICTCTW